MPPGGCGLPRGAGTGLGVDSKVPRVYSGPEIDPTRPVPLPAPIGTSGTTIQIRCGLLGWAALACLGKLSAGDLPYSTWLLVRRDGYCFT